MSSEMVSWLELTAVLMLAVLVCCVAYCQIKMIVCWRETLRAGKIHAALDRCETSSNLHPDELAGLWSQALKMRYPAHWKPICCRIALVASSQAEEKREFASFRDLLNLVGTLAGEEVTRAYRRVLERAIFLHPLQTYKCFRDAVFSYRLFSEVIESFVRNRYSKTPEFKAFWDEISPDREAMTENDYDTFFSAWQDNGLGIASVQDLLAAALETEKSDLVIQAAQKWLAICSTPGEYRQWYDSANLMSWGKIVKPEAFSWCPWDACCMGIMGEEIEKGGKTIEDFRRWLNEEMIPNCPPESTALGMATQFLSSDEYKFKGEQPVPV